MTKQQRQADNEIYEDQTKFDLDTVKSVGNTLLREYTLEMLPEQVEIVVDFDLRPYYGDEDETDGLYYTEAKRGTTAFRAEAGVASGGGRSKNSVGWSLVLRGMLSRCDERCQQTSHRTTGSSGRY